MSRHLLAYDQITRGFTQIFPLNRVFREMIQLTARLVNPEYRPGQISWAIHEGLGCAEQNLLDILPGERFEFSQRSAAWIDRFFDDFVKSERIDAHLRQLGWQP